MHIRLCLAFAVLPALLAAQSYEFPPLAPEQNRAQVVKARMLRSGVHRLAPRDFVNRGTWTVENNAPVYRVTVRSPFAHGIRIHFVSFSVGQGRVRVLDLRNWDYTFGGPYTGMGPWDDGEFWSNTVFGDTAVIEYRPADGQRSGEPPFEILEITHQFDLQLDENGVPKTSESCQLDVNCHSEWLPYARAVAVIVFESDGYQNACSGSLIKSRYGSGEGYFLTANHCVGDDNTAKTVEPFWGYRTERCNGPAPDIRVAERVAIGGRLLATGNSLKGDYSLLLLRGLPQNPVFLDWTTEEPKLNDNLVGVHHPRGTGQRISFGQSFVDYWSGGQFSVFPQDKYHQVNWSYGGITEGGSSGSPLFIRPGVVIGVLTYGWDFSYTPPCAVNPKVDGYGKFNAGFPEMRGFLENPKGGLLTFSPKDLNFRALNG
ncbi:MAG: serine protease, partial [Bryobacter sp.]|nr:serine protease [Bryobacter sp.]